MPPNEAAAANGYYNLWNKAIVRPVRITSAIAAAHKILDNKAIYLEIEKATGVPWQVVGCIHCRESNFDFKATLSDGEHIIGTGQKTRMVPAGRGPYATFQESAIDELRRRGLHLILLWSIERILFETEAYNGWGYLGKCNSPYDWGATTMYGPPESDGGKYIRDHVFSKTVVDPQLGVAAILKELALIDQATMKLVSVREPNPPKGVVATKAKEATKTTRNVGKAAGGAATVGAGNEAGKAGTSIPNEHFIPSTEACVLIAFGLVVAIVAATIVIRTTNLIKGRW